MMDGSCAREIERREAVLAIAKKIAKGSIVAKATERLIYQIVEVCAEHEREAVEDALRGRTHPDQTSPMTVGPEHFLEPPNTIEELRGEIKRLELIAETFQRQYRQVSQDHAALRAALPAAPQAPDAPVERFDDDTPHVTPRENS